MLLPEHIMNVIRRLENAGFEAYVVGGCVRDSLMYMTPHDYDIATSALPEEVKRVFADMKTINTGLKHGTVTVLSDGEPVEITTYRIDGDYDDNRHPQTVTFTKKLIDDLKRRDFTINGIAYNPVRSLFIYDPFEGAVDIGNKTIRCIGNPDDRFHEDALRIMRGLRFAVTLGFDIAFHTARSMHRNKELLRNISAERIFVELSKMLTGSNAKNSIYKILNEFRDVFAKIIPELTAAFDFDQHSKYHYLDIYQHMLKATENAILIAPGNLPLAVAMLLHDIEKPNCFSMENGEGHFYGHASMSADTADKILRRLKTSTALRERVVDIIRYHDMPLENNDKTLKRLLSKYGEDCTRDIILAHIADDLAKRQEYQTRCRDWYAMLNRIPKLMQTSCLSIKDLAVNGHDLTKIIPPSPLMGETLKFLLNAVLNGNLPNTYDELMNAARHYIDD